MSNVGAPAPAPLLTVRNLCVRFRQGRGRDVTAVEDLSYTLDAGTTLAIVGESGAGKTAGCRALMGLLPATAEVSGSAKLDGAELIGQPEPQMRGRRGTDIAMAFQDPARALNPTMRVGHQIAEAVRIHGRIGRSAARRRAIELLRLLEIDAPEQRYPAYAHELSGGMRQRVLLAIALAGDPRVLVADEATRSLDVTTQAQVLDLLRNLQLRLGMAIVMISHDLRLAAAFADDVLVMRGGRSVEYGRSTRLLHSARTSYARALVDAMPSVERAAPLDVEPSRRPGSAPGTARGRAAPSFAVRAPRQPVLTVRDVEQRYPARGRAGTSRRAVVQAVAGVSFELSAGETLGLVGETGAGKSTLARALLQAPRPASGSVRFLGRELTRLRGRELAAHRSRMQMVFQDPFASLDPAWRVSTIIEEPLAALGGATRAERRRAARDMLERVELPARSYGRRRPRELSGGQCQRVAIARALASQPALLICDEGLSSLDVLIQAQMLDLFERLRTDLGLSFLLISHDLTLVRRISDRIAVMHVGRICEIGPARSICSSPSHPYTAAMLACDPANAGHCVSTGDVIHGEPASPTDPPSGCAFRLRCPRAEQRCALEAPRLRAVGESHFAACHFPPGDDACNGRA